jgi:hypothetical protein
MGSAMSDDFYRRRYEELRERWNAQQQPDDVRRERDTLRAENQQLREALERIADLLEADVVVPANIAETARAALAAVVEE